MDTSRFESGQPEPGTPILLIDDRPDNTLLLQRMLEFLGYERIEAVNDPREALAAFRHLRPEIVFLDERMPHLDGLQVLRLIREETPDLNAVQVVFTSADNSPEFQAQALQAGANGFFEEFDRGLLERLLAELAEARSGKICALRAHSSVG